MPRLNATDVTVFTVGGHALIGELTEAMYDTNVGDEDGSAINEIDEDPEPVSRSRTLTGTAFVEDNATMTLACESTNPVVAVTWNAGGLSLAANALISKVGYSTKRKALQTEQFTLKIKGSPTITAPS